jgi:hypothetical protein
LATGGDWKRLNSLSSSSVSSSNDESVSSVLAHGAEAGSSRAPHFHLMGPNGNLVIWKWCSVIKHLLLLSDQSVSVFRTNSIAHIIRAYSSRLSQLSIAFCQTHTGRHA